MKSFDNAFIGVSFSGTPIAKRGNVLDLIKNFNKVEKPLTNLIINQKTDYFTSNQYKTLSRRVEVLKNSNNMKYSTGLSSKLGFPIQKSVSLIRKFVFDQNYRSDQLFYIKPTEATTADSARNMEDVINDNLRRTRFKSTTFNRIKLSTADYGACVSFSMPGILRQPHYKTVVNKDQQGNVINIERKYVDTPDIVVMNKWVDPLNYAQDPDCPFPEESLYQGHIERWDIPEFVAYIEAQKDYLIKSNVSSIFNKLKISGSIDDNYTQQDDGTLVKTPVDVFKIFTTANIKGNEDNLQPYYIEMVENKIIRIEKDLYDENLRPYSIFNFTPRNDSWWGNTDGELVIPHENATNTLIALKMANAIRAEDQIILTSKGLIDSADWNNRRFNGGLVEVDLPDGLRLSDVFYKHQFTDEALGNFDAMQREINASRQSVSSTPNVQQRVSRTSPLQNTTATGVQAMQEQGDIKEGSYTEQFNYGVIQLGRVNLTLLQQFLPDDFVVVSSPDKSERFLEKQEILGSGDISVRTALTNNKVFEAQRYLNAINTVMNWKGTQDPAMMRIALEPIVKTALHRLDLGDINELYPELPPQIQTQQQLPQEAPIA